jgi:molybdopterin synthase sulfur carrier subunit
MAQVQLPRPLARIVTGLPLQAAVEGQTVRELIDALDERWPGVSASLCGTRESLRPHIHVYVDGERATLETPVHAGSVVRVLTAVSGG